MNVVSVRLESVRRAASFSVRELVRSAVGDSGVVVLRGCDMWDGSNCFISLVCSLPTAGFGMVGGNILDTLEVCIRRSLAVEVVGCVVSRISVSLFAGFLTDESCWWSYSLWLYYLGIGVDLSAGADGVWMKGEKLERGQEQRWDGIPDKFVVDVLSQMYVDGVVRLVQVSSIFLEVVDGQRSCCGRSRSLVISEGHS